MQIPDEMTYLLENGINNENDIIEEQNCIRIKIFYNNKRMVIYIPFASILLASLTIFMTLTVFIINPIYNIIALIILPFIICIGLIIYPNSTVILTTFILLAIFKNLSTII